jgi:predicted O-linked N-acetylglucosamine transferase (SPINDLY family)
MQLLGVVLLQRQRFDSAADEFRRVLSLRPDLADCWNNLGVALEHTGELFQAEATYSLAVDLRPDYIDALNNLGNVLRRLGRVEDAETMHRRALAVAPTNFVTHVCLGADALDKGDLDDALKHYWRAASLRPDDPAAHGDLLFWLLHHPRYSDQQIFEAHLKWAKRHCGAGSGCGAGFQPASGCGAGFQPASGCGAGFQPASLGGKERAGWKPAPQLRVGYVSPDFREHAVARFVEPVLANHDPAAVTSVCYSDVARPDAVTARMRAVAGEWHDTTHLSDDQLAEKIRGDRIDILVDLAGHMGGGRLRVFARRAAPVQATYLGYPHSTGVAEIDYRITDAASDPVGLTERFHVERLVRLEGCAWCYRPDEDSPGVTDLPAVKNGFVTFGSFNRMAKITPAVAKVWARVLDAAASSRLLVLAAGGENNRPVRRMLESAGVPGDRLELVPSGTRAEYLAHVARADVGLDPFPYNGMTTTCDLLWLGVPTVTLAGTSHRGRVGASLMGAVGLHDLIAADHDGYVGVAAELAGDVVRLRAIRATLRERMARSPLCDAQGLARQLEAAYVEMCARGAGGAAG